MQWMISVFWNRKLILSFRIICKNLDFDKALLRKIILKYINVAIDFCSHPSWLLSHRDESYIGRWFLLHHSIGHTPRSHKCTFLCSISKSFSAMHFKEINKPLLRANLLISVKNMSDSKLLSDSVLGISVQYVKTLTLFEWQAASHILNKESRDIRYASNPWPLLIIGS